MSDNVKFLYKVFDKFFFSNVPSYDCKLLVNQTFKLLANIPLAEIFEAVN